MPDALIQKQRAFRQVRRRCGLGIMLQPRHRGLAQAAGTAQPGGADGGEAVAAPRRQQRQEMAAKSGQYRPGIAVISQFGQTAGGVVQSLGRRGGDDVDAHPQHQPRRAGGFQQHAAALVPVGQHVVGPFGLELPPRQQFRQGRHQGGGGGEAQLGGVPQRRDGDQQRGMQVARRADPDAPAPATAMALTVGADHKQIGGGLGLGQPPRLIVQGCRRRPDRSVGTAPAELPMSSPGDREQHRGGSLGAGQQRTGNDERRR